MSDEPEDDLGGDDHDVEPHRDSQLRLASTANAGPGRVILAVVVVVVVAHRCSCASSLLQTSSPAQASLPSLIAKTAMTNPATASIHDHPVT